MNIDQIKTINEAKNLIQQLESHIQKLRETEKAEELFKNRLKHRLTWEEVLDIHDGDILYIVTYPTSDNYVETGGIIKLKILKISRQEGPTRTWKKMVCEGVQNDLNDDDFKAWNVVNRVGYPYQIDLYIDLKRVRLVEPIITSNVSSLRPCDFYYRI